MPTLTVELKPAETSAGYATPYSLHVKQGNDAGKTITFTTEESGFAVFICDADKLFADWEKKYWCEGIEKGSYKETPKIKEKLSIHDIWKYGVYCEKTHLWAINGSDAPPIIIIVND